MNLRLRRRHRWLAALLLTAGPAIALLGLVTRPAPLPSLPDGVQTQVQATLNAADSSATPKAGN